jgi:hypothetical protein
MNDAFDKNYPDKKSALSINSDAFFNSNTIPAGFVDALLLGQFINSSTISNVSNNLDTENRLGAELNYSITYKFKPDTLSRYSGINFFFSLQNRTHLDGRFSGDLFNLVFNGNSMFAGQTANLDNFNLNVLQYQQFQIGISSQLKASGIHFGIGLSALNGEQYKNILAKKAELYTSADGQYINLNSDIIYKQSNPGNTGLGSSNGAGFGIDAFAEKSITLSEGLTEKTRIELKDIGLIRWNANSRTETADSLYHYEGISVNNILDPKNPAFSKLNTDSIVNKAVKTVSGKITSVLPGIIHINSVTSYKRWQLSKGIRYMYDANYRLNIYLTGNYFITKKLMVSLGAAYGGYSVFSANAGIGADLGRGYLVHVYSANIDGFIVPQIATGQSACIQLTKKF